MAKPNRSLGWKDLFLCYPIFDSICAHLDPNEILFLRLTTKQLSSSFESLFKTQWNINRQLTRFVKDPISFRSKLAKHNALISGSFALQFFERVLWNDSDLDIYVDGSDFPRSPDPLGRYLVEREGYKLQSTKTEKPDGLMVYASRTSYISQVETYHRSSSSKENPIQIQVIYTTSTPFQAIVAGFNQTLVMNIISWDFAYSLFPDLNFIKRTAYDINGSDDFTLEREDHEDHKTKYTLRGWNCEKAAAYGETKNLHSLQLSGRRRIGDSYTWTIKLDTNGIDAGQPSSVLQHSFFKVIKRMPRIINTEPTNYIVHVRSVKSCVLRYEYTKTIEYHLDEFWGSVEQKLDELTHSQRSKYDCTEPARPYHSEPGWRSVSYWALVTQIARREWTFYDDQIPIWYEQYIKDHPEAAFAAQANFESEQIEMESSIEDEAEISRAGMTEFKMEEVD